ncbi:MAG TPA: ABC transporter permease [Anaerolineaceae bacterium]|nr:ABC transporter permease [Anaerolineaceae bacterium]
MEISPKPFSIFPRSFLTAAWLGWKIESNWTDPFLFAVYSIIKPLAGAMILVVMYGVIANGNYNTPIFAYIYIGNAFYRYVGDVMTGISFTIIEDREHYRTLRYIYTAPIVVPFYLLGRGVARFLTSSFAVVVVMGAGILFLHLPFDLQKVDWLLFLVGLLVGVVMLAMLGLILAGITLLIVNHNYAIGDAVSGALFLFSGAIFPLDVLPVWLRPIGFIIPVSYWLELLRRALIGNVAQAFPTFSSLSNLQLLGILVTLAIVFGIISVYVFRLCDHNARERGLIDLTTNY